MAWLGSGAELSYGSKFVACVMCRVVGHGSSELARGSCELNTLEHTSLASSL